MIFSSVLIIVALFILLYGIPSQIQIDTSWTSEGSVNARTMPYFAGGVLLITSALELAHGAYGYIRAKKSGEDQGSEPANWTAEIRAILMFLLCLGYSWLFSKTSFLLASAIAPPLALAILADRNWKHYAAVYGVVIVMYLVFRFALGIRI